MKKGFTMIEILAVFTITAVILLVTVPFATGMLKKADEKSQNEFNSIISMATEAYIQSDSSLTVDNEHPTTIRIDDLVKSGFLESTIVNPANNKRVTDPANQNLTVVVTRDVEGVLQYKIEGAL